jgi:(2Fe-2S) ferredoxin
MAQPKTPTTPSPSSRPTHPKKSPRKAGHQSTRPTLSAPQSATQPEQQSTPQQDEQPIWQRHVFVCTSGSWCPAVDGDGLGVHARLKQLVAEAGLKATTRVNHSGCFDQCGYGPMVVIYPEGVWYWGVQPEDVDEIVSEHLIGGRPVERLRYRNTPGKHKLPRDEDNRLVGRPDRRKE